MILSVRGIAASVPGRVLYRELLIELGPGLHAVIGPNGAGKSTLLRQLAGIAAPDAGSIVLDGVPLASLAPRARATRVAYLPQSSSLYSDLRVREVVMLGRAPYLGRFAAPTTADDDAVAAALAQVGAGGLADRAVSSLSGGELQRVMLARMLAGAAPVLILDEPTTALDIGHALAFLELLAGLSGRTVVVAMHDLELARRYAGGVLCLRGDGSWVSGSTDEVMTAAVLEPLFGVRVERGDALRFAPALATPPSGR